MNDIVRLLLESAPASASYCAPTTSGEPILPLAKERVDRVATKIRSFADLPIGWHYGSGGPSPQIVVEAALRWCDYLRGVGLSDIDAFPGDSGEILLSAIFGSHSVDIITEVDGTVSVAYERNDVELWQKSHVYPLEAQSIVAGLAREIWNSSAGSIVIDLIPERSALPAWPSGTQQTMGAFRYPNASVSVLSDTPGEVKYASTHANAT